MQKRLKKHLRKKSIVPSYNTLLHLTRRDQTRNSNRERAILETQKRCRRQLTARAITAASSRKRRAKTTSASSYKSGKFGTEMEPEESSGNESDATYQMCKNRVCPIGRKRRIDEWVGCDICECWFHSKCAGVSSKTLGENPYICEACS